MAHVSDVIAVRNRTGPSQRFFRVEGLKFDLSLRPTFKIAISGTESV